MKNPKTIAGLIALAVMLALGGILAAQMIPTIQETRREMSLTPTPIPDYPASVLRNTPDPAFTAIGTTAGSQRSAGSSVRPRSMSFRSCGTSCAAI